MNRTLYFDTETINSPDLDPFGIRRPLSEKPGLIQLSAILVNDATDDVIAELFAWTFPINHKKEHLFLQVDNSAWHKNHGMTSDKINRFGINSDTLLRQFRQLWRKADKAVAHFAEFDVGVIRANYQRTFDTEFFDEVHKIPIKCTCLTLQRHNMIANLENAYTAYVDARGLENAHNAKADTYGCWEVAKFLRENKIPLSTANI